jgi:hypothetical protein
LVGFDVKPLRASSSPGVPDWERLFYFDEHLDALDCTARFGDAVDRAVEFASTQPLPDPAANDS